MRAATPGQLVPAVGHDIDAALPQLEVVRAAVLSAPGALPEPSRIRFAFYDPVLTARILRLDARASARNAPFTLEGLIARAGEPQLRGMIWGAAETLALGYLGGAPLWQGTGYWLHALVSANVAWSIAELVRYPSPDEAYVAGLLQDVGMLALTLRPPLAEGTTPFEEDRVAEEERTLFGTDHTVVGARLADEWGLSPTLADAILLHHASIDDLRGTHMLVRIAKVAEALSEGAPPIDEPVERLAALLDVDGEALFDHAVRGAKRAELVATELGINVERLRGRTRAAAEPRLPRGGATRANIPAWTNAAGPDELVGAVARRARWQRLGLQAAQGNDMEAGLALLRGGLQATYGVNRFMFFRTTPGGDMLTASEIGDAIVDQPDLAFPIAHEGSLVARAARGRRPLASSVEAGAPLAGVDRQLLRRLGAKLLVCVPAVAGERLAGVLVCGVDESLAGEVEGMLEGLQSVGAMLAARTAAPRAAPEAPRPDSRREIRRLVHEVRNPLAVMRNYLELLGERLPPGDGMHEIAVLKQELDRVNGLLDVLAGQAPAEPARPVDVHQLLDELVLAYGKALFDARGITLAVSLDPEVRVATPHANALRQIVLNLLKNASEALGPGKRVELATALVFAEPGQRLVEIAITDDGPGIAAAALERIAADSDRDTASGRGHGLRNCMALAQRVGAQLLIRRRAGGGTAATLLLPARDPRAPERTA
jgi:signal transduction histidine kinase/HD-like signal output (HDOD) protein